jgi:hypothetical protein
VLAVPLADGTPLADGVRIFGVIVAKNKAATAVATAVAASAAAVGSEPLERLSLERAVDLSQAPLFAGHFTDEDEAALQKVGSASKGRQHIKRMLFHRHCKSMKVQNGCRGTMVTQRGCRKSASFLFAETSWIKLILEARLFLFYG